jgi:hypothetical protein
MEKANIGLIVLAIILLATGYVAYLYPQYQDILHTLIITSYPYHTAGLILILAGIVILVLGLAKINKDWF